MEVCVSRKGSTGKKRDKLNERKNIMKKAISLILTLAMLLCMTACGGTSGSSSDSPSSQDTAQGEDASPIVCKIASVLSESSPCHEALLYFCDRVEELAPGRIAFELYPNSQLFSSEREMAEGELLGTIHGAIISENIINSVDPYPMLEMGNTPFLIKSAEAEYAMLEDFYAEEVEKGMLDRGFTNLSYFIVGGVDIGNSVRDVVTPADIQGLKIRSWEAEGPATFLNAVQANPMIMAFGEVYTALQQQTIDGVITSDFQFNAQSFTDIIKHVTSLHVFYNYQALTFSRDWVESLPADLQEVFYQAGAEATQHCRAEITPVTLENTYKTMEAAGVTVTYLTNEQKMEWYDMVADTWDTFRENIGPEVFDRVVEFMSAYDYE